MAVPAALTYPMGVTFAALAACLVWVPFADLDQLGALVTVAVGIVGYTIYRLAVASGWVRNGLGERRTVAVRRVRQEYRLLARSWLEFDDGGRARWVPVYFDPALIGLVESEAEVSGRRLAVGALRLFPAGRVRDTEPVGRLVDNPSRRAPDAAHRAATVARPRRRLLLDAQAAVVAPFAGLMWVYVVGGGVPAFAGASCVAAAAAVWLSAVRGSDPS
ncbi:hypothetical protein [Nocardia brevicatena]|uniref:hypothetical protein n=1 Tax=Nocardia brevicatena TaxID=37327 RepID=UPI0002FF3C2B